MTISEDKALNEKINLKSGHKGIFLIQSDWFLMRKDEKAEHRERDKNVRT